jgi:hypothetical protein
VAEPRHHTPRSDWPSHGWRAAKVAEAKGRPFMPWQRDAADVALEVDPDTGLYRYGIVVVSVQRQAGKTDLEGSVADQHCLWNRGARVRITMQDGKTADEWMREQHFPSLEGAGLFRGRYTESRRAGSHGVAWTKTRSSFTTFPPTRTALHSKQTDKAMVDEAWALDATSGQELKQAIRPTMATRPNAQLWVVSTRGDDRSAYLDEYVARGVASMGDPDSRVCFIDYGLPVGADAEDLDVIAQHHPAVGRTITRQSLVDAQLEFIHADTGVLDVAGWARAYGNVGTSTREYVFPDGVWTAAARPRPPVPDRVGLGLDVSPDGHHYAVAAGWRDPDGHGWVEVLSAGDVDRSTPELAASLARARGVPLWVDRQAQAALEVTDGFARLDERDRPTVEFLSRAQYGSACVTFSRGIYNATVHHTNDADLDAAVKVAGKRSYEEGGFGWSRRGTGSIAPLVACTVALRGVDLLPAPKRKPVARA